MPHVILVPLLSHLCGVFLGLGRTLPTLTFKKVRSQSKWDGDTTSLLHTFIHYLDRPVRERTSLKKMYCRVVRDLVVTRGLNFSELDIRT